MAIARDFVSALRGMLTDNKPFLKPAETFSLSMSSGSVKLREKLRSITSNRSDVNLGLKKDKVFILCLLNWFCSYSHCGGAAVRHL